MEFNDKVSVKNLEVNGTDITDNVEAIDSNTVFSDPEGRTEVKTDSEGKILSYRDSEGVMHENVGIAPEKINYTKTTKNDVLTIAVEAVEGLGFLPKTYHMPKYGTVNMVEETFYLTADNRYSDLSGVTLIQDYEDTQENASQGKTLSYYYINATLKRNDDGTYSKYNDGVAGHDVKLDFYAAGKITKIDDKYYAIDSLEEGQIVPTSIEVTQCIDIPPYKAWSVDKKTEHYCNVVIDFGYYLSGTFKMGVKYQGSSTLFNRKRNWRFTFYKSNAKPYYPIDDDKFGKKDKIKIGELVRLSGYNLKANWTDNSRIKEWMLYRIFLDIWENRPDNNRFPWDIEFGHYTGATGLIKGFPVKVSIGGEFYGMHIFGLKKDEKNYMLDGTDESGIFVSGSDTSSTCWVNPNISTWEDEMMDEMSQETSDALNDFFEFINGRLVVGGQTVPFDKTTIPERMDMLGFIDYFIGLQLFIMWDNTCRNMVLHTRSDKKKFYPFFYDLDTSLLYDYDSDVFEISTHIPDGHGGSSARDTSLWEHIKELYWDEIVNRWCVLRNNVLNINYIRYLFETSISQIPDEDYSSENERWGTSTSKINAESILNKIEDRLTWLDENYFIV